MQVVATAGHVDHGKSALLVQLTGMEPDRWEEERRRGLTIDLGYVWTTIEGDGGTSVTVAFVDVPGHDHFLPNMLCGVGATERVLFVVAADDGWSAQSEEHLRIVDLLGMWGALVVVTKADLVDTGRLAEVVADVERRLAGTSLHGTPVLAADSVTGRGIAEVRAELGRRLGQPSGRPFGQRVEALADGTPWLWVDRAFTITGAGPVVTGMLTSGALRIGDQVAVLPTGRTARIRGLQRLGRPVDAARAGERVAVNLSGVTHDELDRGMVVVAANGGAVAGAAHDRLDVELRAAPDAAIGRKGDWHLHLGTAARAVRILPMLGDVDPGDDGLARLELSSPIPVRCGQRFVLREAGRRVVAGGGVVLDPAPRGRPRGPERRLQHALVLDGLARAATDVDRLTGLVASHGGVRRREPLQIALGSTDEAFAATVQAAPVVKLDQHLVLPEHLDAWLAGLAQVAGEHEPDRAVPASELTTALSEAGCPEELLDAVLDLAVDRGVVARHGGRYVATAVEARYLAARDDRQRRFVAELAAVPLDPPDPQTAADRVGIPGFEVQELVDQGGLVACGPLLFTADAVAEAVARLRAGPGRGGASFAAAQARDVWGNGRRAAVPLLEHLRAVRVTSFDGTRHRLR